MHNVLFHILHLQSPEIKYFQPASMLKNYENKLHLKAVYSVFCPHALLWLPYADILFLKVKTCGEKNKIKSQFHRDQRDIFETKLPQWQSGRSLTFKKLKVPTVWTLLDVYKNSWKLRFIQSAGSRSLC